MLTFNNDEQFKKDFVAQIVKHRKQDQIVQGTYGKQNGQWHGCYLGCSLRSLDLMRGKEPQVSYSKHSLMESEGICPVWLALLGERIFENLPSKDAPKFVEQLTKAIPVGVNLDKVKWQFMAVLMQENIDRVLLLEIPESLKKEVVNAIRGTLSVAENAITTGVWDVSAASAASAEWSAVRAPALSAFAALSEESAESAASAALAACQKHAKTLIRLLTQAGKGNQ